MADPFESSKAKIVWAKEHIHNLNRQYRSRRRGEC